MHALSLATISVLALAINATPTPLEVAKRSACMCDSEAEKVANNFKALIDEAFSVSLAKASMMKDFHDYSDSVNELINAGCPNGPATLGEATFSSRAEFISGQSAEAPIPFSILNLWHTCDTVIMRWMTSAPGTVQPEQPVTGIIVIETVPNTVDGTDQPWLMNTVYSEFNSGAWLYDVGNLTCTSAGSKKAVRRSVNLRPGSNGRGTLL